MEKTLATIFSSSFSITDWIGFLFFQIIHQWFSICRNFFLYFVFFSHSFLGIFVNEPNAHCMSSSSNSDTDGRIKTVVRKQPRDKGDVQISREDVEIVMEKLGMPRHPEAGMLQACFFSDELSTLFVEKEPSLEEAREAFSVFDENGDEFIDARELQRALSKLGFSEASKIEACEKMIRTFDQNGDGRIDFNEFLKLLEDSFC